MYNFSDYLIDYLEFQDISHNEFAKQLRINPAQLSMILNKKRKLSFELMNRISMITPFTIDEIVKVETTFDMEKKIEDEILSKNDTLKSYIKRYKYKTLETYDENVIMKDIDNDMQVVKDIRKEFITKLYNEDFVIIPVTISKLF